MTKPGPSVTAVSCTLHLRGSNSFRYRLQIVCIIACTHHCSQLLICHVTRALQGTDCSVCNLERSKRKSEPRSVDTLKAPVRHCAILSEGVCVRQVLGERVCRDFGDCVCRSFGKENATQLYRKRAEENATQLYRKAVCHRVRQFAQNNRKHRVGAHRHLLQRRQSQAERLNQDQRNSQIRSISLLE
jgi:hypothetical protein